MVRRQSLSIDRQRKRSREPLNGEGAPPVRRSLRSYGHLWLRSAKLDPLAPRRRSRSQQCNFVLDRERCGLRGRRIARIRRRQTPGKKRYPEKGYVGQAAIPPSAHPVLCTASYKDLAPLEPFFNQRRARLRELPYSVIWQRKLHLNYPPSEKAT